MTKSVATGLLITYVMILFGYGAATAGHHFLHAIKNPFHTHGQVHEHEQDHGHEHKHAEQDDDDDHHTHEVIENEGHHADNDHDHVKKMASKGHEIEDHTHGLDKLNGQDQGVSPTETLNPLFIFVYTQSYNIIEGIASSFNISETEHHYLSLYKSLGTEPATPPPPSIY